jgi:peroxiredoxin
MTDSYYTRLGIAPNATADEIRAAYERQRARYSPERLDGVDAEIRRVAAERAAALDAAYTTLIDPQRRAAYDQALAGGAPARRRLSRRELALAVGGALVGLLIVGLVWALAGRTTTPALPPVAEVNRPAANFKLVSLDGTPVQLSDYRGKVVLLNFWYTGCEPCKEETPALQEAYRKLADKGLVVLGVNVRPNERSGPEGDADVRRFAERYGVGYPIVLDTDGAVGREYQVFVLPTSLFVDQDGTIRYARFSTLTSADVEQIFAAMQREPSAQQ